MTKENKLVDRQLIFWSLAHTRFLLKEPYVLEVAWQQTNITENKTGKIIPIGKVETKLTQIYLCGN